jgi:hypothetical protein
VVKSARSSFLFIAETLVLRRSIFTSYFYNILSHRASNLTSLATSFSSLAA